MRSMPNATIQTKGERPRDYRPLFREGSLVLLWPLYKNPLVHTQKNV